MSTTVLQKEPFQVFWDSDCTALVQVYNRFTQFDYSEQKRNKQKKSSSFNC